MEDKDFTENGFYKISNYIMWFILSNFYFIITNLPLLIVVFIFPALTPALLQIALSVALIFTAPSVAALFSIMGKLVREKDIDVTKDFFKAYKTNFGQAMLIGLVQTLLINILYVDIIYFNSRSLPIVSYLFYFLLIYVIALSTFLYPIMARFYLKTKDLVILSIVYSVKKLHFTIANIILMVAVGFLLLNVSSFVMFFAFSAYTFVIIHWQNKVLEDIEEKIKIEK
ncbi:YesL family protein [Clostridium polynesiense]|uniref:YesL family protein n=1 Tax=Clostridium polynesiense TaxID=1325933 RepID=UPI00058E203B|nr:DUF624 domain-containing protein [Clostridium polynesiense]